VLLAETGVVPSPEAVEKLATSVRQRLHGQAHEAQAALGPTPDELSRAEADLRIYAHDLLHWGHDNLDLHMYNIMWYVGHWPFVPEKSLAPNEREKS
jgi:hypothetical protein